MNDKSVVLAPFNSLLSLNDTLEDEKIVLESNMVKFGKNCRELNRIYE